MRMTQLEMLMQGLQQKREAALSPYGRNTAMSKYKDRMLG